MHTFRQAVDFVKLFGLGFTGPSLHGAIDGLGMSGLWNDLIRFLSILYRNWFSRREKFHVAPLHIQTTCPPMWHRIETPWDTNCWTYISVWNIMYRRKWMLGVGWMSMESADYWWTLSNQLVFESFEGSSRQVVGVGPYHVSESPKLDTLSWSKSKIIFWVAIPW